MNTLNFLSALWGFGLLAIGAALLATPKNRKAILRSVENEAGLFYVGLATFMLGIASLLSYHAWSGGRGSLITIIGWLAIIKGVFLLFCPATAKKVYTRMTDKNWMIFSYIFAIVLGLCLIYASFKI
jgi:uncharacterized protein YjeT (DUF2065 family)